MSVKQTTAMRTIRLGRKLFYNTPVQKWGFTGFIYDAVFHMGYARSELSTVYLGAKLTFPGRDFTITPGLMGGFYERYELELFREICNHSRRVVDVGGNIGLYTVIAAQAGASVTVYEPVPENKEYLNKNVNDNNVARKVKIVGKAVGAETGLAKIFLSAKNIGTHSLASAAAGSKESIDVEVTTLDDELKNVKVLDVLKVDVEGYDGFVLEGASRVLSKFKPTLFIEFVPSHLAKAEYEPTAFIDLLYKTYRSIYCVDEVNDSCKLVSRLQMLEFASLGKNVNLIATANASHKKILNRL